MLFGMVERGMGGEVVGDKGKLRATNGPSNNRESGNTDEALWAVVLTKELWRKGVWFVQFHIPNLILTDTHINAQE